MPRPRFSNLAPRARSRLLGVATKHFAKRGFENASLNEILAEAGISKGAYYYYFEDKDDLFATALESAFDELLAKLPLPSLHALAPEQFWPTVERLVKKWAAAFDTSSDLFRVAVQLSAEQRSSPRFAPMLAKAQTMYRALIEPGQELGCIRRDLSVDVLVRLLEANDAVLDSIFLSKHTKITRASVDEHVELVFDTFKRLLVKEPASHAPALRRPRSRRV